MKPIQLREADFKKEVEAFSFPESVKKEFFEYWSEPNKSNTKMRFELEKTWHLGRRIARWANNGFNKEVPVKKVIVTEKKIPLNNFERLDAFMEDYFSQPLKVKFSDFADWYEFMKENKLLKTFTRGEVDTIKLAYGNDNSKCRSAAVQSTLDTYRNTGLKIVDIIALRGRLNA